MPIIPSAAICVGDYSTDVASQLLAAPEFMSPKPFVSRPASIHALFRVLTMSLALWGSASRSQTPCPEPILRHEWKAEWIAHPTASLKDSGVFHFRKIITLDAVPPTFVVHTSADNRFILFVNGQRVGEGPARGDLGHWRYETLDLAPFLHSGENVIAAVVWNWGLYEPLAQMSDRTAFLMDGDSERESPVNTDESWQVEQDPGFSFTPRVANGFWFYWAADTPERLDGRAHDWDWKKGGASAGSNWVAASRSVRESIYPQASHPTNRVDGFNFTHWAMVPDTLPQMEHTLADAGKVVRTDMKDAGGFPEAKLVIPPHRSVTLLIDRDTMITGYPEITVGGGKGATVRLGYAEALYDAKQQHGSRGEVGDRVVLGQSDEFLPDGGSERTFTPLWFRAWRFLEIRVTTADDPITLESLKVYFRAYPFKEQAHFASNDPELARIWDICWRGARLGAHETYMDTPYWEQLQYVFDTRIQALISYTVAGDDRLGRQALRAFAQSQLPEGVTQSRYPSSLPQVIPSFSLEYIGMLHDYWMYRTDTGIVRELLPSTRDVLRWFQEQLLPDGFLRNIRFGEAVDTPMGGDFGNFPPRDNEGRSSVMTLLFVQALRDSADMEEALGDRGLADKYRSQASRIGNEVYRTCWNPKTGMLSDVPGTGLYSQHANLEAVLADVIPASDQPGVMQKMIDAQVHPIEGQPRVALVSYPYQFLLARAVDKVGLGAEYQDLLRSWRKMVSMGFTTVPEGPDPSRSDTHAWSAHPIFDMLTTIAGIHPGEPGFARVRITPALGPLQSVSAIYPHPAGIITTSYKRQGSEVTATITLPPTLEGTLVWRGVTYPLTSGLQTLHLAIDN